MMRGAVTPHSSERDSLVVSVDNRLDESLQRIGRLRKNDLLIVASNL